MVYLTENYNFPRFQRGPTFSRGGGGGGGWGGGLILICIETNLWFSKGVRTPYPPSWWAHVKVEYHLSPLTIMGRIFQCPYQQTKTDEDLGLAEIKTYAQKMQDAQVTKSLLDSKILPSNFSVTPNNDMTGHHFSNYYNLGTEVIWKPIEWSLNGQYGQNLLQMRKIHIAFFLSLWEFSYNWAEICQNIANSRQKMIRGMEQTRGTERNNIQYSSKYSPHLIFTTGRDHTEQCMKNFVPSTKLSYTDRPTV